jgi:hypothetical protein
MIPANSSASPGPRASPPAAAPPVPPTTIAGERTLVISCGFIATGPRHVDRALVQVVCLDLKTRKTIREFVTLTQASPMTGTSPFRPGQGSVGVGGLPTVEPPVREGEPTPKPLIASCLAPITGIALRDVENGSPFALANAKLRRLLGPLVTLIGQNLRFLTRLLDWQQGVDFGELVDFDEMFSFRDPFFSSRSYFHLHNLARVAGFMPEQVGATFDVLVMAHLYEKYKESYEEELYAFREEEVFFDVNGDPDEVEPDQGSISEIEAFRRRVLRTYPEATTAEKLGYKFDAVCISPFPSKCTCAPPDVSSKNPMTRLPHPLPASHPMPDFSTVGEKRIRKQKPTSPTTGTVLIGQSAGSAPPQATAASGAHLGGQGKAAGGAPSPISIPMPNPDVSRAIPVIGNYGPVMAPPLFPQTGRARGASLGPQGGGRGQAAAQMRSGPGTPGKVPGAGRQPQAVVGKKPVPEGPSTRRQVPATATATTTTVSRGGIGTSSTLSVNARPFNPSGRLDPTMNWSVSSGQLPTTAPGLPPGMIGPQHAMFGLPIPGLLGAGMVPFPLSGGVAVQPQGWGNPHVEADEDDDDDDVREEKRILDSLSVFLEDRAEMVSHGAPPQSGGSPEGTTSAPVAGPGFNFSTSLTLASGDAVNSSDEGKGGWGWDWKGNDE